MTRRLRALIAWILGCLSACLDLCLDHRPGVVQIPRIYRPPVRGYFARVGRHLAHLEKHT